MHPSAQHLVGRSIEVGLRNVATKVQLYMQPFWKDNALVPSWSGFLSSWWNNKPPTLLTYKAVHPIYPIPGCLIRKATPADIHMLPEFWGNYYSQSRATKCCITVDNIQPSWDIWVVIHYKTGIIGTIVRRWIHKVNIKGTYFPKIGAIEYYCVHPAWRKKGIGRNLLWTLQNESGITPHFILWESFQVKIPPIAAGMYWVYECQIGEGVIADEKEAALAWNMCKTPDIHSEYTPSKETLVCKTASGYVIVWNTYHRTIPEGRWIGIVLGQSSERALEEFIRECPFGILVSDKWREGWKSDTTFQWISYMLEYGFVSTSVPYLCWS